MKRIQKSFLILACPILSMTAFLSCDFGDRPDPDHPLFVSYTISVSYEEYSGPDELLTEIKNWIEKNSVIYDTEVNYSTGAKEEFAHSDAEAIQKFEQFLPKFKDYLNDVTKKLSNGAYGSGANVKADFYVYAVRGQGESRNLRSEHVAYVYPVN